MTEALFVELWRVPEEFPITDGPLGLQMVRRLSDRLGGSASSRSAPAKLRAATRPPRRDPLFRPAGRSMPGTVIQSGPFGRDRLSPLPAAHRRESQR